MIYTHGLSPLIIVCENFIGKLKKTCHFNLLYLGCYFLGVLFLGLMSHDVTDLDQVILSHRGDYKSVESKNTCFE